MPLSIEDLIRIRPALHVDHQGRAVDWGINEDVLRFLCGVLQPGSRSVETGAGISTLACLLSGSTHTAVAPDDQLRRRILDFCHGHAIDPSSLTFISDKSQNFLPLYCGLPFDVAVIDGDHAFPIPFIDYYYLLPHLRVGGYLIVDDVELWTGGILTKFLNLEPEWACVREFRPKAVAYRKVAETPDKGWSEQPYTVANSLFLPDWARQMSTLSQA